MIQRTSIEAPTFAPIGIGSRVVKKSIRSSIDLDKLTRIKDKIAETPNDFDKDSFVDGKFKITVKGLNHKTREVALKFPPQKIPVIKKANRPVDNGILAKLKESLTPDQYHFVSREFDKDVKVYRDSLYFAAPGTGKTRLALTIASLYSPESLRVVIINNSIRPQWENEIKFVFGDVKFVPNVSVAREKGTTGFLAEIICIKSAHSKMLHDVDCTIFDEVHMYCTKNFGNAFVFAKGIKRNIAITADEDRKDGGQSIMRAYFPDINNFKDLVTQEMKDAMKADNNTGDFRDCRFSILNKNFFYGHGSLARARAVGTRGDRFGFDMELHRFDPLYETKFDDDNYSRNVGHVVKSRRRNEYMSDVIVKKVHERPTRKTVVFCERTIHCLILSTLLQRKLPDFKVLLLSGKSAKKLDYEGKDPSDFYAGFDIIVTTYKFAAVGFSVSSLDTLVVASPKRTELVQLLGRIMRTGYKPELLRSYIDFSEVANTRVFLNQFHDRIKALLHQDKWFVNSLTICVEDSPSIGDVKVNVTKFIDNERISGEVFVNRYASAPDEEFDESDAQEFINMADELDDTA